MKLNLTHVHGARGTTHDLILSYNAVQAAFNAEHKALFHRIENAIQQTGEKGKMPLWEGYEKIPEYVQSTGPGARRSMTQVRTGQGICQFYTWLAVQRQPETILEFGAAFGASGMYWLAGLGIAESGQLVSFEPNAQWCDIARANFDLVNDRHVLTAGTFEENTARVSPAAGITLIDAIHTKSVVLAQFELVKQVSAPGALVIFDDLNFSDDMWACWQEVCAASDVAAAWQIGKRVGIVELR